jgi:olefin beta-lactone synthetase
VHGFNVANAIRAHAEQRGDQPALLVAAGAGATPGSTRWERLTFGELDAESDAYARGLARDGVRAGDRVLFVLRPGLKFYVVLFGLFKLGAVPVVLDPQMGARALLACIERTRPRAAVMVSAVNVVRTTVARRAFASLELVFVDGWRGPFGGRSLADSRDPGTFAIVPRAADDDAAILFTSGSTGTPKGVEASQRMFAAQVEALRQLFDFRPGQKDLQCFASFVVFDLCLGFTAVLPAIDFSRPARAEPTALLAALGDHSPDVAFASPIIWQNTSRYCVSRSLTMPSVSTVITVGAAIPPSLHRRMTRILPPGTQVWTPYGATEGLPITNIGTAEILAETAARTARGAGTCVGTPAPGAWVRVIPIRDAPIERWSAELALAPGQLGEIVIGGDQVSRAYKDADQANVEAKIRDGDRVLHRTGDLGQLDDQGRLWFCGRKAHRIEPSEGVVLAADAVEGIFNEHPEVFRSALVGIGPRGRQVPVLCVELERGGRFTPALEEGLRQLAHGTAVEGRIARFLPHPGFPTDARHNSKIRREDLAPWAAARCRDLAGP